MLKIILGVSIVAFATFCGYLLSKKYRQRRCFFTCWREFNEQFIHEIAYFRRPISDFLSLRAYEGEFQTLLQEYAQLLQEYAKNGEKWLDLSRYSFLANEEKTAIFDYFMMLGKGDSASQKAYFLSVRDTLVKYQIAANEQGKKYEDLYIKLGFLCGLFILILII